MESDESGDEIMMANSHDVAVEEPVSLENTWSFWHDKFIGPGQSVEEYEASLHKLCTFSTIQVTKVTTGFLLMFLHRTFGKTLTTYLL